MLSTNAFVKNLAVVALVATLVLAVTGLPHLLIYHQVAGPLLGSEHNPWVARTLALLWLNLLLGFAVLRVLPMPLRKPYEGFLFLWMGLALFLVMAAVPVFALSWMVSFRVTAEHQAWATAALASLLAVIAFIKAQLTRVVATELPFLLPQHAADSTPNTNARGVRVAVLSDVHVSGTLGTRRLKRIMRRVHDLKPDLIFILGDLVDGTVEQLGKTVLALSELRAAGERSIYFVTGNHEYFFDAASWKSFLKEHTTWNVLENSHSSITCQGYRLIIAGIEDRQSLRGNNPLGPKQPDSRLHAALKGLSDRDAQNALVILLAHQPKDAHALAGHPSVQVQVSGHTHGGQIWPFGWVARREQGFLRGLYQLSPRQWLYVSTGTGYWGLPFRLGTHCELSLLHLLPAKPSNT